MPPEPDANAAELQRRKDYIDTFATPHGKRVIADLMANADFFTISEEIDPLQLARSAGRRSMVMHILTESDSIPTEAELFRQQMQASVYQPGAETD